MTRTKPPAAHLIAGLALAPIAGVPAVAGVINSSDPVFDALATLDQLKITAKDASDAHTAAEEVRFSVNRNVTIDGKELRSHELIDAHFRRPFECEDEDEFNRVMESLRPRPLSPDERAERDRARQAAHDELARREAEFAEVEQRTGFQEIEARMNAADDAQWDAEYEVMETEPTTAVGAFVLLHFVADWIEKYGAVDGHGRCIDAIRNAVAVLEREAMS